MGDLKPAFRVTLEQFHAFRDERPCEEKWELIDGVMTMMPPPSLVHQRIAANFDYMLNDRIAKAGLPWRVDRKIGLLVPDDQRFDPEPDLTVIDAGVELGQLYAERFYFVAEVLSPNDKPVTLGLKRGYYQAHEPCRGMIFIRQDRVEAELIVRDGGGWQTLQLNQPGDAIVIPEIGEIGPLGALYRHTPLQPAGRLRD